jgi:DNA-binding NtrC family response regulator
LPLQAKLLTVLQQRKVQKVGSSKEIPVNFRLICATNMQLHEMVYEKTFRQDLLYRINTVEIRVPALRERSEDIPLLLDFFLQRYGTKYKRQDIKIEKSVVSRLKRYHWPGNIRELQHAVERAVILTDSRAIHSAELFINTMPAPARNDQKPVTLDEMEKQFIEQSLVEHSGNVSNTARTLGMTRTALYRRMKKHGIG